jgi:hypothetical protein
LNQRSLIGFNNLSDGHLGTNTGFLVNSGSNSIDLEISTIISELTLGDASNSVTASDSFFYLTDNGAASRLFQFADANGDANIDSGEVTGVATFRSVFDATDITASLLTDFAA